VLKLTVARMKEEALRLAEDFSPEMLQLFIHLVHLACHLMSTDAEISSVHELAQAAVQTDWRTYDDRTLLHLAVDPATSLIDGEWYLDLPSSAVVECLLVAGEVVNSKDERGNTPLHEAVFKQPKMSTQDVWLEVVNLLLLHGAHIDFANASGETAYDKLLSVVNVFSHVSLKCLAARAIRMHRLPYHGIIPTILADFVDRH